MIQKLLLTLMLLSFNLYANAFDDGLKAYNSGDKQKAVKLYSKACDSGYTGGCSNLGVMYANGEGVRQNKSTAKKLFGKACDGGLNNGCRNYRILNEQGVK